jgi:hypothetical protein
LKCIKNQFTHAKAKRKAFREKLDQENGVSDEVLKRYVDDMIREDLRTTSYNTLIAAKKSPGAIIAYYNFVNADQLYQSGKESFGNICCLSLDRAEELLKRERKR